MFPENTKALGLPEFTFASKLSSNSTNPGKPRCEVILVFRAVRRQTCWQDLVTGQVFTPQRPGSTLPTTTLILQNTLSIMSFPNMKIHDDSLWGQVQTALTKTVDREVRRQQSDTAHRLPQGTGPISWDIFQVSGNKGAGQGHRLSDSAAS